jgi:hypothetical protein
MRRISRKRFEILLCSVGVCLPVIVGTGCDSRPSVAQNTNRASPGQPKESRPHRDEPISQEERVRRALKTPLPEGPRLAAKAYEELFTGATEARLRALAHNPNPSIALQARWELRGKEHRLPSDAAHPDHIPGFLEGDFGLRAPLPWAAEFSLPQCRDNTEFLRLIEFYRKAGFPGVGSSTFTMADGKKTTEISLPSIRLAPELHQTSYGPSAPKNIELTKEADKVFIAINDQTIPIIADFFPYGAANGISNLGRYQVAATVRGDKAFVAVSPDGWGPLSLYCLERGSGKVIWRSSAWTAYVDSSPGGSGFSCSQAELVCDDSRVTVFERGTYSGACIESFDARTGDNQLRFSSRYWHCRDPENSWSGDQRPSRKP